MQAVQQHQVRHDVIVCQRSDECSPWITEIGDAPEYPIKPRPVEIQEGLHEFAGLLARDGVGESLEILDQGLEMLDSALRFAIRCGRVGHNKSPVDF